MEPVQSNTLRSLSKAINNSKGIIVYRNGQYKSNPLINFQSHRKLFENISIFLASGSWFTPATLEYPLCDTSLIDPLSKLKRGVINLGSASYWIESPGNWEMVLTTNPTYLAYLSLKVDIDIVNLWLREVSDIGKITWQMRLDAKHETMEIEEIEEYLDKLENWKLSSFPKKFSILGNHSQLIKNQALDLVKERLQLHRTKETNKG